MTDWKFFLHNLRMFEGHADMNNRAKDCCSAGMKYPINLQNPQNFYHRRKRTAYYEILPLWGRILLTHGTHAASRGVFYEE
jgi:hypothetical protein